MRKVIGAVRQQLIAQHLVESIIVTLISALFALLIAGLSLPILNSLYQRFADFSMLMQPVNVLLLLLLMVFVGVISGVYPAFVLSSFKPIFVLKGAFKNSTGGIRLRKALVVLQFTISIALMVGTGVVYQQMKFIYTADLGFDREQVVTIQQNGDAVGRATTLRNELQQNSSVVSTGTSSVRLGQQLGRTNIVPEGANGETNIITSIMADGRNFSLDFADSASMIINEEMAKLLKWKDPVGRTISLQNGPDPTDLTPYKVVGVIKDFHFATIRHKLEPMFMLFNPNNGALSIRIKTGSVNETLAFIEQTWKKVNPGTTFEYAFLDEQFANLYRNEEAFATMFTHFTVLALVIAALGLFALSAYTADQRRKEIGIRKVLGASSASILFKLSNEFIQLILISFVLASVLAYWMMNKWLADFQYRIEITAQIFLVAGMASVAIALTTVSFQALKATLANPVNSLRSE
jgi:putative ABC transport system permease protein